MEWGLVGPLDEDLGQDHRLWVKVVGGRVSKLSQAAVADGQGAMISQGRFRSRLTEGA